MKEKQIAPERSSECEKDVNKKLREETIVEQIKRKGIHFLLDFQSRLFVMPLESRGEK